ncbi:MAG: hypothetical protein KJ905_03235 [Nanoarchaeota archaeon]|nr:hypothetical protein [Nanoarchaeota archaeon]MBU1501762.1 hypothetical protein [Nanoarchaeota archaeon]MBU2459410.1 hypothetical protein [Nanoarchaeota archaeon]
MVKNLEEGDIVFCTVDRIIGTNVFVRLDSGEEACIVFSEIAPGRIRNIRDYVFPQKKIICKVLRLSGDRIDLSLRRVTPKDQKDFKDLQKHEKSYESILKNILGKGAESIIEKILKEDSVYEFLQEAKTSEKGKENLENLVGKEEATKVLEVLNNQKQKKVGLKKEISLTTSEPNGIELIKNLLKKIKEVEIKYISAGKYILKKESTDIKKADRDLKNTLIILGKEAKKMNMSLTTSVKQKEKK